MKSAISPLFIAYLVAAAAACSSETADVGRTGSSTAGSTTGGAGATGSTAATSGAGTTGLGTTGPATSSSAASSGATGAGGSAVTSSGSTSGAGGAGGSGSSGTSGAGGASKSDAGGGGAAGSQSLDGGAGSRGSDAAADARSDGGGMPPGGLGPAGGACPIGATFGEPLPQNRTATLIRGGFAELEGPVWVASQKALYFCEAGQSVTTGRIHKYTPATGTFVVFVDNVGVGGLAVDQQGMLVAASHDMQRLSRFDPVTGARTDVAGGSMYMGKPFNQVNDVVVRSDGNMYFSDPEYALAGRMGQGVMAFYRLSPAGIATRIVVAQNANGVALSPDGSWLYLATTDNGPRMQRFAVAADGSVAATGTTWTDPASDGMAVDCAGNLYLSDSSQTNQIRVISPADQPIGNIVGLGGGYVTNSAFGGDDRKTLYITTSQGLYQIPLNVPGFPN